MLRRPAVCLAVPFDTTSASYARRTLHDDLVDHGMSGLAVADATHVLYELVMNGVEHGLPDADDQLEVSWIAEATLLRISVLDRGSHDDGRVVAARAPTPDEPGGRGLAMVAAFSDHWVADRSAGTRVTAWISLVA